MAFSANGTIGAASRPVLTRPVRRGVSAVRAKEEDKTTFFEANKLSKRGYLEEDSAGQENIFAVQPRKYLQGSDVDETTGSAGNTAFGVAGAALALVVIASGTTALINQTGKGSDGVEQDFSGLSTLTEYKAKFVADTRQPEPVESPPVS